MESQKRHFRSQDFSHFRNPRPFLHLRVHPREHIKAYQNLIASGLLPHRVFEAIAQSQGARPPSGAQPRASRGEQKKIGRRPVAFTVSGARRTRLRPGAGAIPETMLQNSHFEIQPLSRRIPAPSVAAVCDCRLHVDTPNQSAQFCNSVAPSPGKPRHSKIDGDSNPF